MPCKIGEGHPASVAAEREGERRVRPQAAMREVNEQIHKLGAPPVGAAEVFCECSHGECLQPIAITEEAYEDVRRFPGRFIVAPGHEDSAHERVVADHGSYLVVEKVGSGATTAVRGDPRRQR